MVESSATASEALLITLKSISMVIVVEHEGSQSALLRNSIELIQSSENWSHRQKLSNNVTKSPRSPSAIKEALLSWCQAKTRGYKNVAITNFSSSWADGMAFCALIHHFYPESFNFDELDAKNRAQNLKLAFETADKKADIMPLLEVEDMLAMGDKPDWKCIFTYVQCIYRQLRNQD
uniref:Calponin-homology (CH) domain-containing protein n=1 Tax=Romanomermis culicivorax TaxID=13658 RepID=A0A915JYZ6_ROMCU